MAGERPSPLIGLRFVAAFALFVFHVREGHRVGLVSFTTFDELPLWIERLVERSFVATSLFFVLSGHVLAQRFLVADDRGATHLDRPAGAFFVRRVTRVWPLHAATLLIFLPGVMWFMSQDDSIALGDVVVAGVAQLFLVQAWWPPLVMSWNIPTWALSVVVAFYALFALVAVRRPQWLRRVTRGEALVRLGGALLLALVPATLVALRHDGAPSSMSIETDVLWAKFHPLVWMPIFFAGAVFARSPWSSPGDEHDRRPSVGDAAWCLLLITLAAAPTVPYLFARHGLAVPLMLVGVADLERRRGVAAWILSTRIMHALGCASFAVFIVQLPVVGASVALLGPNSQGAWALAFVLVSVVVIALFTSRLDQRVTRRLRARMLPD